MYATCYTIDSIDALCHFGGVKRKSGFCKCAEALARSRSAAGKADRSAFVFSTKYITIT